MGGCDASFVGDFGWVGSEYAQVARYEGARTHAHAEALGHRIDDVVVEDARAYPDLGPGEDEGAGSIGQIVVLVEDSGIEEEGYARRRVFGREPRGAMMVRIDKGAEDFLAVAHASQIDIVLGSALGGYHQGYLEVGAILLYRIGR